MEPYNPDVYVCSDGQPVQESDQVRPFSPPHTHRKVSSADAPLMCDSIVLGQVAVFGEYLKELSASSESAKAIRQWQQLNGCTYVLRAGPHDGLRRTRSVMSLLRVQVQREGNATEFYKALSVDLMDSTETSDTYGKLRHMFAPPRSMDTLGLDENIV